MTALKRAIPTSVILGFLTLAACVTVNVYFPASATEKAADRIIDDIWGPKDEPVKPAPSSSYGNPGNPKNLFVAALDFVLPKAEAAEPNVDISSPEIQRLTASMETRHATLLPHLSSGAIGLTADGQMAPRDPNLIPLAERNKVRGLVADENADRIALYRQIAAANGNPQWEAEIRKVFSERWIARASPGWWYQDANGAWKQK